MVQIETIVTKINKSGYYKPRSPIFRFVNTGPREAVLNNNFILLPGNDFGINMITIVSRLITKGIQVECNDQYQIFFPFNAPNNIELIETFIKKV